ncbi:hypothetical protein QYE76_041254 [Lolium multiflorum]|uniref:Uncharacterized protein n=1 Tax=Lolium multiflorum TaxID=4521 RepID=A0AAD8TDG6_LOLMU|nr:hypothetical protein QYE76_041254 [Lolium multiflorum]
MYAGDKDVDRLSKDLSVKDLEKLVQKISSLSKKDAIPTSCHVEPYSGTNALPENHRISSSLPPLPEGGEVEERIIVTDDAQVTSRPESEVAVSHKSAASSEREIESEASESTHSIPSTVSPRNKRKRGDAEGSGTSKLSSSPVEETAPDETSPEEEEPFNAYDAALVRSGDEEEEPAANVTAPMSTSHTLALSETHRTTEETLAPHQDLQSLGTQFIGYRDTVNGLKEDLVVANKRADDLAVKLEKSEEARKKAEKDATSIEDLRKRLHEAETALSDNITQQIAREENVIAHLESQSQRFVSCFTKRQVPQTAASSSSAAVCAGTVHWRYLARAGGGDPPRWLCLSAPPARGGHDGWCGRAAKKLWKKELDVRHRPVRAKPRPERDCARVHLPHRRKLQAAMNVLRRHRENIDPAAAQAELEATRKRLLSGGADIIRAQRELPNPT